MATVWSIHERKPIWQWIGEICAFLLRRLLGKSVVLLATGALIFVVALIDDTDRRNGARSSIVPHFVRDYLDGDAEQVTAEARSTEHRQGGLHLLVDFHTMEALDDRIDIECRATTHAGKDMFTVRERVHASDFPGGTIPANQRSQVAMRIGPNVTVGEIRNKRATVLQNHSKFSGGAACTIDCRATFAE